MAQQEIAQWQEMGLLSPEVALGEEASRILEFPARDGGEYWYGRLFPHRYAVSSSSGKYYINMEVDTASGKIIKLSIEADADADDVPVPGKEVDINGRIWYFYTNYDDIFSPDMTVDRFCSLLAEYWGFSGYTLSGTQDSFYPYNTHAPLGDTLLTDFDEEAYLTVYFDGDQSGAPMYVELLQFPGQVCLMVGTRHSIG